MAALHFRRLRMSPPRVTEIELNEVHSRVLAIRGDPIRRFAALTAIFAKVGVEAVNSDFATFIRTIVILLVLAVILAATGQWQSPFSISSRTCLFLLLSGFATGAWWICYFRALKLGDAARVC